jgi:hypothetical protein
MLCYPPYALLQVMAMASLGGVWWVQKAPTVAVVVGR